MAPSDWLRALRIQPRATMHTRIATSFVALGFLSAAVAFAYTNLANAQGGESPTAPTAGELPLLVNPADPALGIDPNAGALSGLIDPFVYDERGRRDPFAQPIDDRPAAQGPLHGPLLPLQKYEVAQIRLIGIIWDVARPKAMIKDPDGKTHIVGTNTKIGPRNGYIAVIREGEIVVVETIDREGRLLSNSQVVRIAK